MNPDLMLIMELLDNETGKPIVRWSGSTAAIYTLFNLMNTEGAWIELAKKFETDIEGSGT
jgi:hypothetical protein